MKKGTVNKLSIVMAIITLIMVFYTMGMPDSFVCRNHLYEAEDPEAFRVQPHYNLVIDEEGNVSAEDNEEYIARQAELKLAQQRVKDKIDPVFDQKISRIPLWFLYTGEYSEFSDGILQGLMGVALFGMVALILYKRKPAVLLTICCIAIPVLIYLAYQTANHPTFCK